MAITFNKTGIAEGNTIKASHVTQSYDAFTSQTAYDITLSGSLTLTGSVASYNGFTGSFTGSLNGDFIGYDNSASPISIKIGFMTNLTIPSPSSPVTYTTTFSVNNIISVVLTPVTAASGLDWYPVVTNISGNTFTVAASNPTPSYNNPIIFSATIFYN